MGYPQHPEQPPHGPYEPGPHGPGQHPYDQGYGQSYDHRYGRQQPTIVQPAPRRNVGVILLLAIGLPLLMLGGCAAVVIVLGSGSRSPVVITADQPLDLKQPEVPMANQPGDSPAQAQGDPAPVQPGESAPAQDQQAQPNQGQGNGGKEVAAVGGTLTLEGINPGLKVDVTITKVFDPATPDNTFMKPKSGNRFVAVQLTLTPTGSEAYSSSPGNGAYLIDGEGQQFSSSIADVREGQGFVGSVSMGVGDTRKGVIVFEVPQSARLATFQFSLNSGFADQKGEWRLS